MLADTLLLHAHWVHESRVHIVVAVWAAAMLSTKPGVSYVQYTIRTSWITPHHFVFRGFLFCVMITPPITQKIICGDLISAISKKNCTFLYSPSWEGAHHRLHQIFSES